MHVHREIYDLSLMPYVGGYVQQLRGMHAAGTRWYNTTRIAPDHLVTLRIAQDHLHVRISPRGGPQFEAFYSDHVDGYFYATPGYRYFEIGGPWNTGGIQGGGWRATFPTDGGAAQGKAVYSTNLEGAWPNKSVFDVGVPLATQSKDFFKTWASWQMQRVGEYASYPDNKSDSVLTSTWGTPQGRLSMAGWGDYHWGDILGAFRPPYDIVYDMAPTLYQADGSVLGVLGPYLGDECWWRHGGMQTVQGRKFFIIGDNKGRIHVYPAKAYWSDPKYYNSLVTVGGLLSGASSQIQFKTVTPTYPDWVSLSPVNQRDVLLWWNWAFNKDGTKAATIALHEQPRVGFAFYNDPSVYDITNVSTWRGYLNSQFRDDPPAIFHTSKKGPPPRVLTPGLVEIGIKITVTGDHDMDFDVEVVTKRSDWFGDSGRYYQDAAYSYGDKRLTDTEKGLGIPEDTLLTTELQCYSDDGTWYIRQVQDPAHPDDPNETVWETHEDGSLWFRGDPALYEEGSSLIAALINAVWVVRRGDTDTEVIREPVAFYNSIGDFFFPSGAPLNYLGPDGYGGTATISGIWLHNISTESDIDFFNNGPGHGPFHGNYCYGGIFMSDLRSLTYGVFRNEITYTGHPVSQWWRPDTTTSNFHLKVVAFGEQQLLTSVAEKYVYPADGDWLGHQVFIGWFPLDPPPPEHWAEPDSRPAIDKIATPVYSSAAINFMNLQTYNQPQVHPNGHFSVSFLLPSKGAGGNIDILSFRDRQGKETRTTHEKMFNRAFGQKRGGEYYDGTGCYGFEVGSFRLSGWWLPYRSAPEEKV